MRSRIWSDLCLVEQLGGAIDNGKPISLAFTDRKAPLVSVTASNEFAAEMLWLMSRNPLLPQEGMPTSRNPSGRTAAEAKPIYWLERNSYGAISGFEPIAALGQ